MERKCNQEIGECIEGDILYIECRKPGDWKLFRMTENHKGSCCIAKKNAKAVIERKYTNVKK